MPVTEIVEIPTGTVNVPGLLNVCEPPGTMALPPSTPIFDVPIAILNPFKL
jgi:hypothetical protein